MNQTNLKILDKMKYHLEIFYHLPTFPQPEDLLYELSKNDSLRERTFTFQDILYELNIYWKDVDKEIMKMLIDKLVITKYLITTNNGYQIND